MSKRYSGSLSANMALWDTGESTSANPPLNYREHVYDGLDEKLWRAADKLRGHISASEYKHVMLGLLFIKYASDTFYQHYQMLSMQPNQDAESPQEYISAGWFWVAPEARWPYICKHIGTPDLASILDAAADALEAAIPSLNGALPRGYQRSNFDQRRLGELVEVIGTIDSISNDGNPQDMLGRVYEYFLGRFARAEGSGGEFYTPQSVVKLLVQMLEPYHGRVYDPCCGSGGMFVQSQSFVDAHGGSSSELMIYGQELNPTTWGLCKLNLAIRGIQGDLGEGPADTILNDLHPSLTADFILANPPFNVSDWGESHLRTDKRWQYGIPSANNANFAWLQHIIAHLAPQGVAGIVLTNGSLSTGQEKGDGSIRKALIEADLVDCIVTLPSQLFYNTQISACLWILSHDKGSPSVRAHHHETLFIHAQRLGRMTDRTHRELQDDDIDQIAGAYHSWRSSKGEVIYADIPGFCATADRDQIRAHKWALVPGRYVGFSQSVKPTWDISHLSQEIAEVEAQLATLTQTSERMLSVLKELLRG